MSNTLSCVFLEETALPRDIKELAHSFLHVLENYSLPGQIHCMWPP